MQKLIELFWAIACRKSGPEVVPKSLFLAQVTGAAYLIVQIPLLLRQQVPYQSLVVSTIGDLLILCAFTWLLLRLTGKSERLMQTLTALFGVGVLISIVAIPVGFMMYALSETDIFILPFLALLGILIWSVLAAGHIFACALSRAPLEGIVIALFYYVINYQLIQFLL